MISRLEAGFTLSPPFLADFVSVVASSGETPSSSSEGLFSLSQLKIETKLSSPFSITFSSFDISPDVSSLGSPEAPLLTEVHLLPLFL